MSGSTYVIDDPKAVVDGKTIAQWTEDWWTWALQSPAHQNAIDDPTGQFAHVHNGGSVFFLGGTNGGDAVRDFSVPAGKPLLLPMINHFDTLDPRDVEQTNIQQWLSTVTNVFARIDGKDIMNPTNYIENSGFFSMGKVTPNTLATEMFGLQPGGALIKGQELTPTLATGYYLMIEGLSPGQHTLEFGGSTNDGFQTHVIDHIKVG